MSYATGTTHYNLPQTVGTDKRDWTDTNEAFASVDTALYGAVQDAETATSGIQTLNTAVDTINGKLATDEGNISTLSGKVSTLESTVSGHTSAIADVRSDLQDNIESRKEASATSTHAYSIGDTFYYNDVLYKATANIGVGDTIVPNTNCTGITVMSEIQSQTAPTAAQVSFNNTASGLDATTVQGAIDEIVAGKGVVESGSSEEAISVKLTAITSSQDFNLSKITPSSYLEYDDFILRPIRFGADYVSFNMTRIYTQASPLDSFQIVLGGSSQGAYRVTGTVYADVSSDNLDGKIVLHY